MKKYCHVLADVPGCCLDMIDKLQKWVCRTVIPTLAGSPELLGNCRNIASFSLFYRYYFGRYSSELAELVPLPYYSRGRSTCYYGRLHDFFVTVPRYYDVVYVNSFFPQTGRLSNSLPAECFSLTYDLNDF